MIIQPFRCIRAHSRYVHSALQMDALSKMLPCISVRGHSECCPSATGLFERLNRPKGHSQGLTMQDMMQKPLATTGLIFPCDEIFGHSSHDSFTEPDLRGHLWSVDKGFQTEGLDLECQVGYPVGGL